MAAYYGQKEMIHLLLDHGPKPFYKNKVNQTWKINCMPNLKTEILFEGRLACWSLCFSLEPAIRSETIYWAETFHTDNEQFQVFLQAYKVSAKLKQQDIMHFNPRDMRKCSEDTPEMRKQRLKSDSGISVCGSRGEFLDQGIA
jgi:hypothetical protein